MCVAVVKCQKEIERSFYLRWNSVVIQDSILSARVYNFYNTDRETGSVNGP